jgi:hypothetical protein
MTTEMRGYMRDIPQSDEIIVPEPQSSPSIFRWIIIAMAVLAVVIVAALIVAIVGGITGSEGIASAFRIIRDFFIIVLALQGILISIALVILTLQLTALINLLRNEITPLIDEMRRTMATVRGTTEFVSRNVAAPIIKVSAVMAGARAFIGELAGIRRNVKAKRIDNSNGRKG